MSKLHYTKCPVCSASGIHPLLTVKDHTVSGESFVVWQCDDCTLRFTQDVPDETSIGPYYKAESYISHTNSNKGLINRLYQQVRRITLKQKAALIEKHSGLKNGSLLDVGCGTGAFLATMQSRGWKVQGIEPDADARAVAKEVNGIEPLPAEALSSLPEASFDMITLWHVLEHVQDLHGYLERLKSLLKPGGSLLVAVPNYQSSDAESYGISWAAYDVPRHLYHFTPKAMEALVKRHEMQIVDRKPMWFDSFYVSLLSSKYRHGKVKWLGALFTGLRSNLSALADTNRCSSVIYLVRSLKG